MAQLTALEVRTKTVDGRTTLLHAQKYLLDTYGVLSAEYDAPYAILEAAAKTLNNIWFYLHEMQLIMEAEQEAA